MKLIDRFFKRNHDPKPGESDRGMRKNEEFNETIRALQRARERTYSQSLDTDASNQELFERALEVAIDEILTTAPTPVKPIFSSSDPEQANKQEIIRERVAEVRASLNSIKEKVKELTAKSGRVDLAQLVTQWQPLAVASLAMAKLRQRVNLEKTKVKLANTVQVWREKNQTSRPLLPADKESNAEAKYPYCRQVTWLFEDLLSTTKQKLMQTQVDNGDAWRRLLDLEGSYRRLLDEYFHSFSHIDSSANKFDESSLITDLNIKLEKADQIGEFLERIDKLHDRLLVLAVEFGVDQEVPLHQISQEIAPQNKEITNLIDSFTKDFDRQMERVKQLPLDRKRSKIIRQLGWRQGTIVLYVRQNLGIENYKYGDKIPEEKLLGVSEGDRAEFFALASSLHEDVRQFGKRMTQPIKSQNSNGEASSFLADGDQPKEPATEPETETSPNKRSIIIFLSELQESIGDKIAANGKLANIKIITNKLKEKLASIATPRRAGSLILTISLLAAAGLIDLGGNNDNNNWESSPGSPLNIGAPVVSAEDDEPLFISRPVLEAPIDPRISNSEVAAETPISSQISNNGQSLEQREVNSVLSEDRASWQSGGRFVEPDSDQSDSRLQQLGRRYAQPGISSEETDAQRAKGQVVEFSDSASLLVEPQLVSTGIVWQDAYNYAEKLLDRVNETDKVLNNNQLANLGSYLTRQGESFDYNILNEAWRVITDPEEDQNLKNTLISIANGLVNDRQLIEGARHILESNLTSSLP